METDVILTPELEHFAQTCVQTGRFSNVGDVIRSALRLLQDVEARRTTFVASLEAAMAEGDRDGFVSSDAVEAEVTAAIQAASTRRE